MEGKVKDWFESYLSTRTFNVAIDSVMSTTRVSGRGVPQGSVLGPRLFIIYTAELALVLDKHGVKYKLHADDTQIYLVIENF